MKLCEELDVAMNEEIVQVTKDLKMVDKSKATGKGKKPIIYLNGSDGYWYNKSGILNQIRAKGEIKEFGFTKGNDDMAKAEKDFMDKKITMSAYYELASELDHNN